MNYVIALAATIAVIYYLAERRPPPAALNSAEHQASSNRNLRRILVERLRGDEGAAERLIERERKKRPAAPENDLLRFVIASLENDRWR